LSRKQSPLPGKPAASQHHIRQYFLAESEVVLPNACEKLINRLERDGAKNLKVYAGVGLLRDGIRDRIVRKKGGSVLHSCAAASGDLLAWLEARNVRIEPLVIEAEVQESRMQKPLNWRDELTSVRKRYSDTELSLKFGDAWKAVKKLAEADDPLEQEQRIENLWRMYPKAAEDLGLPKQRSVLAEPIEPFRGGDPVLSVTGPKPTQVPPERLKATIESLPAARRMEAHLRSKGMGQTDFAIQVGTTDRTLRSFRRTGKVRRDIFGAIARAMNISNEELLKPE
jgi:hypothetical protein